jgi:hypothetical protein
MNATNIDRTTTAATIEVFGMHFISAESALREFGFTNETEACLAVDWYQEINYWEQPSTVREIHGETVLVRDLNLKGFTMLDGEKLEGFYIVEGRTLAGTQRLYALRFTQQENGPAAETWTEIPAGTVRVPYAVDDEGEERRVVLVRLVDGSLLVKVTGQEALPAWRSFAVRVVDEARKI